MAVRMPDGAGRDLAPGLVRMACAAGADAADAVLEALVSDSISVRSGQVEACERSETLALGLRVLVGRRQAFVSLNVTGERELADIVDRAVAMARSAPEDPDCGLADEACLAHDPPDPGLHDGADGVWDMAAAAMELEAAALAVRGVTRSEGASAWRTEGMKVLATSHGFAGESTGTNYGFGVSVVAGEGQDMQSEGDGRSSRRLKALPDLASLGARVGARAVRKLGPRQIASGRMPVILSRRVASRVLLGNFAGLVSGTSVVRGTSFLKDSMGTGIFPPGVLVEDDPLIPGGHRSRGFDDEGCRCDRRALVEDGHLLGWLLDAASARRLGLQPAGNASRGLASPPRPSPSNLRFLPGTVSRAELFRMAGRALYVTDIMGFGFDPVTGDFSNGVSGYMIGDGEVTFPVSGVTIAGNLRDMFRHVVLADDLEFRSGIDSPTAMLAEMTVGGT